MKKTFKVIMLSTQEKVDIGAPNWWLPNQKKLIINNLISNIYILSDEEIKEGDWHIAIGIMDSHPYQCIAYTDKEQLKAIKEIGRSLKIVATTDTLNINREDSYLGKVYDYLPQLPKSFIQAYIKAYNEGKPITEVDLEMVEEYQKYEDPKGTFNKNATYLKIKTRPDNTVIVHQSKMYSTEQVINLLKKFDDEIYYETDGDGYYFENLKIPDLKKFIQDNL